MEREETRVVSASRRVRETSEFVALNAIEAYLEALRQQELTDLATNNVAQHQNHLDLVRRKADGGAATVADIQQAESRLAQAETTLVDSQTRLRDAQATYTRIVGEEPEDLIRPSAPNWAMPASVETAVSNTLTNNPSVAVAKADVDTALSEYRSTQSAFLPSVSLRVEGTANRGVDGVRGGDYDGSAMLELNYNLFNGNRDVNTRNELTARIGESRQRHNRSLRLAEEEMRLAWNAMLSARDSVQVQRTEVAANERVRDTYGQQFDLGSRTLLELLDSENELFLSAGNLTTTEFLNIFSVYKILATSGLLMSTLEIDNINEANTDLDPVEFMETDMSKYQEPEEQPEELDLEEFEAEEGEELDPEGETLDPNASLEVEEPTVETASIEEAVEPVIEAAAVEETIDPAVEAASVPVSEEVAPTIETAVVEPAVEAASVSAPEEVSSVIEAAAVEEVAPAMETTVSAVETPAIVEPAESLTEAVPASYQTAPTIEATPASATITEEVVPVVPEVNMNSDYNNLFQPDMAPVDNNLSPLSLNTSEATNG